MPIMKISKAAVEKLPAPDPSGKQTLYWSEGTATPGLGILVSGVSATKSWICQGNVAGKARRITLGRCSVLSPDEAWELAKPKLASMLAGKDPKLTATEKAIASQTVEQIFEAYLKASPNLAPNSIYLYKYALRHLGPLLPRTLREISPEDVEKRFEAIRLDVAERRQQGLTAGGFNVTGRASSNVAIRLFGALWEFQSERDPGLGPNPVRGRRFARQWHDLDRRTRHVPAEQLPRFYAAAKALHSDIQRDLVIATLFLGWRQNEIIGLRWDECDLPNRMFHLPASRMKSRRNFDLPMSDVIHQLLVVRRAVGLEGEYVFPNRTSLDRHTRSFDWALHQIHEATGMPRISSHDLRRTFISITEQAEVSPIISRLLTAHSVGSDVHSGYVQVSLADLRAGVQKVCDRMKQLCQIEDVASENVVKMIAG